MTREDIIRMAREADREWDCDRDMVEWLEWFAFLVAAAAKAEEREACAKVCEDLESVSPEEDNPAPWCIAAAIRAREQA